MFQIPNGLLNDPAKFRRSLYVILFKVGWQFAPVYIEDITTFSKLPPEHIGHV